MENGSDNGYCIPAGMSLEELSVVYSAAILVDDDITITADKINAILKAANLDVEPIWPQLYARALSGIDVKKLLTNIGGGLAMSSGSSVNRGAVTVASPAPAEKAQPAKEEKKKEESEGDDDDDDDGDLGMNLFDF